ncbi:hypothetical protein CIHG_07999 [Coccidioides immitis H538.4]|uniref:Uncharacterized protein n=3 Tax=Coccidioides immitis TaxID=5501 RepID=A0A0J8QRJ9_COCIT|nr:hypothetical protein CIRG_08969 [Coccidioides immitis RMSCC 2394]KMU75116.1 hypothetical protein CISG_04403 [Coccidioides immitis RMSCC 3703]KMU90189.1 hypothetical protein CIHG_07999 [Coccidioides immitis H538.4]
MDPIEHVAQPSNNNGYPNVVIGHCGGLEAKRRIIKIHEERRSHSRNNIWPESYKCRSPTQQQAEPFLCDVELQIAVEFAARRTHGLSGSPTDEVGYVMY